MPKSTIPAKAAAIPTLPTEPCPVAQLLDRANQLCARVDLADLEISNILIDQIDEVAALAKYLRATSWEGVLCQVAIANDLLYELRDAATNGEDVEVERYHRNIARLLYRVAGSIEAIAGIEGALDAPAIKHFLTPSADPNAKIDALLERPIATN